MSNSSNITGITTTNGTITSLNVTVASDESLYTNFMELSDSIKILTIFVCFLFTSVLFFMIYRCRKKREKVVLSEIEMATQRSAIRSMEKTNYPTVAEVMIQEAEDGFELENESTKFSI